MPIRAFRALRLLALASILPVLAAPALARAEASTTIAEAGDWRAESTGFGLVKAWRAATVLAPAPGIVEDLALEPGQRVADGQVLARLDSGAVVALLHELLEARERVDAAERLVTQLEGLYKHQLGSLDDVLKARESLGIADEELNEEWRKYVEAIPLRGSEALRKDDILAKLSDSSLEKLAREVGQVRAPFSGIVTRRFVAPNSWVALNQPLIEIEDQSRVIVEIGVGAADVTAWREGEVVGLTTPDRRDVRLELISDTPLYERQTGLVVLRFRADNADAALLDGQLIDVHTLGRATPVVWVPASAVVGRGGKLYCIVRSGQELKPVEVVIGARRDQRIPVLRGLKAGDEVVTKDAYELLYRDLNQLMIFED